MLRLLPQAMTDAWLLEKLPGKTLEEIDSIDLHRHARAWQVQRMQDVEARRRLFLQDKLKADALSADEWRMIAEHDRLVSEADSGD